MALTVCNILILVTHFYRVFRNGEDFESGHDYTSRNPRIVMPSMDPSTTADASGFDSGLTSVHYTTDDQQSQVVATPGKSEKSSDRS